VTGKATLASKNQEQALVNRLLQVPALNRVPSRFLQVLLKAAKPREVPARTVLCRPGEPCAGLRILLKGSLALREPGERLRRAHAVALVGELPLLAGEPCSEEVVAVEDSLLLEVPAPVFAAILGRSPELCQRLGRNVVAILSARVQQANEALNDVARRRTQLAEAVHEAEGELNDLRVIHGYRE
jgi:CRP-like cAMP-binding protein